LAGTRRDPRTPKGGGLLPLFVLSLLLGILLFWLAQGPRHLVAQALGFALGEPVRLAANPGFFLDEGRLGIVLHGLRIGPTPEPLLHVPRLQLELSLSELLRGQLRLHELLADRPSIRGPWPGTNGGSAPPPLPRIVLLRDASLQWSQAGHTLHLRDLDLHWQRGRLDAHGRWSTLGASGDLTLDGWLPYRTGSQAGRLQAHIRSDRGLDRLSLNLQDPRGDGGFLSIARIEAVGRWHGRDFSLDVERLGWQGQDAQISFGRARLQSGTDFLGLHDFRLGLRPPRSIAAQVQMQVARPQAIARLFTSHLPPMADPRSALDPLQLKAELHGLWRGDWSLTELDGRLGKTLFRGSLHLHLQPLRLDLALHIPALDLAPYLPKSAARAQPGPLPALPKEWPVQGRVDIGQLRWRDYTARQLVVEIRP